MAPLRYCLSVSLSAALLVTAHAAEQSSFATEAADFERRISEFAGIDPFQPATIRERIAYARLLHEAAADDECLSRLEAAGQQLAPILAASADQLLALPDAAADAMSLLQTVQLRRADCLEGDVADASLRESISTGERAISLLEANWDYDQMAIARFNLAVARRNLGDTAGAIGDLEQVIAWDREFGQLAEARSDHETLLAWQADDGEPDPLAVENFAAGLKQRSATPAFRLWPQNSSWETASERLENKSGTPSGLRWGLNGTSTVARDGDDWLITSVPDAPATAKATVPSPAGEGQRAVIDELLATVMTSSIPQLVIAPDGAFKAVRNLESMRVAMVNALNGLAERLPAEDRDRQKAAMKQAIDVALSEERLTATMAGDWGLTVTSWIGTPMDHGDWYEVENKEPLPGLTDRQVTSLFQFRLARWLPCGGPGSGECIEILMRNTPDPDEMNAAIGDVMRRLLPAETMSAVEIEKTLAGTAFALETRYRLVTEPTTLRAWSFETRKYLYVATVEQGKRTVNSRRETQTQQARFADPR